MLTWTACIALESQNARKKIVKAMKRSEGSLRQKALALGILAWDIAAE